MTEIDVNKYCDHEAYDGRPLPEGMVLVPFRLSRDLLQEDSCILPRKLTTWQFGGFRFLIGFAPIDPACFEGYMKWFWQGINEYLAEKRAGKRSPDTDPEDGPACCRCQSGPACPDRGLCTPCRPSGTPGTILSLDALREQYDFEPEDHTQPSPEEAAWLEEALPALLAYLHTVRPRYAGMAALSQAGLTPEEIFGRVGLKPSRGYQELGTCRRLAREFLRCA